jgi:hypothetical protein
MRRSWIGDGEGDWKELVKDNPVKLIVRKRDDRNFGEEKGKTGGRKTAYL